MFEAKEDGNPILNKKKQEELRTKARQAVSFEKRLQVETMKQANESRVPNKPLSMTFINENAKVRGNLCGRSLKLTIFVEKGTNY